MSKNLLNRATVSYYLPRESRPGRWSPKESFQGVTSGCPSFINELEGCILKDYGNKRRHELERVRKGNAGRSQKGPGVVKKAEGNHG